MYRNKKTGFTLVELLAVIVILAIILVIAVPQIMSTIKDTTKASFESSAKMVAAQVETQYTIAKTLGKEFSDTGSCMEDWVGLNDIDYASCIYEIVDGTAKVMIEGQGKFKALSVCGGTRSSAIPKEGESCIKPAVDFSTDSWETIITAVKQAEEKDKEYPYEVGNTKTIELGNNLGTHTIRIANKTKCSKVEVESKTACGFVLEFADIITNHEMNGDLDNHTGHTNVGGWPACEMRLYVNETIYNTIPEKLRKAIIDTYVVSSHGKDDTTGELENENFGSTDKLYLLSTEEVWAQGESNAIENDTSRGISRQLDYYATYEDVDSDGNEYIGVSTTNYAGAKKQDAGSNWWWGLRSAESSTNHTFYYVTSTGIWNTIYSYYSSGVSPAFRLAE